MTARRLTRVAGGGLVALVGSWLFLHGDLSIMGSLVALATIAVMLLVVTTCAVTVSACRP